MPVSVLSLSLSVFLFFFFFLVALGFELKASHLLHKHYYCLSHSAAQCPLF
jgi:hypothetical protein